MSQLAQKTVDFMDLLPGFDPCVLSDLRLLGEALNIMDVEGKNLSQQELGDRYTSLEGMTSMKKDALSHITRLYFGNSPESSNVRDVVGLFLKPERIIPGRDLELTAEDLALAAIGVALRNGWVGKAQLPASGPKKRRKTTTTASLASDSINNKSSHSSTLPISHNQNELAAKTDTNGNKPLGQEAMIFYGQEGVKEEWKRHRALPLPKGDPNELGELNKLVPGLTPLLFAVDRQMAVVGQRDEAKLYIRFPTARDDPANPQSGIVWGEWVKKVYSTSDKFNFDMKDSVNALNKWRRKELRVAGLGTGKKEYKTTRVLTRKEIDDNLLQERLHVNGKKQPSTPCRPSILGTGNDATKSPRRAPHVSAKRKRKET